MALPGSFPFIAKLRQEYCRQFHMPVSIVALADQIHRHVIHVVSRFATNWRNPHTGGKLCMNRRERADSAPSRNPTWARWLVAMRSRLSRAEWRPDGIGRLVSQRFNSL